MYVKGVKLKSESFFSISLCVLELWRKTLGETESPSPPPDMDRVKIFARARNRGKKFPKLSQTSFSGNAY